MEKKRGNVFVDCVYEWVLVDETKRLGHWVFALSSLAPLELPESLSLPRLLVL